MSYGVDGRSNAATHNYKWVPGSNVKMTNVVYFDLCLGAAHSKHWSKYAFSHFSHEKCKKGENEEREGKMRQKHVFGACTQ